MKLLPLSILTTIVYNGTIDQSTPWNFFKVLQFIHSPFLEWFYQARVFFFGKYLDQARFQQVE